MPLMEIIQGCFLHDFQEFELESEILMWNIPIKDHIMWLMNRAIERANEFNIPAGPIDFRKTQGVVKRIIPAVASTNAVIGMFGLSA